MADHDEHGGKEEHKGGGSHGGGGHHRGGGGGHAEGEHEGAPEWLISFADNVALMMGFFVILLAMNMGPKGASAEGKSDAPPNAHVGKPAPDMIDFVISIRQAFNNPIDPTGSDPGEAPFRKRLIERTGGEGIQPAPAGRFQEVQSTRPSDYRQITASIPFDDNSAILKGDGRRIAVDTAQHIRGQGWIIEIRGHASQFEANASIETGMRLSHERGLAVVRALIEAGVKRENLRVVACADHDRLVARTNEKGEARTNQRVEIVITNEPAPPDPFSSTPAGHGANRHKNETTPGRPTATPAHKPEAPAEDGGD